ncbi:MarR family winged helix-turn-helix transcriptional regulator [Desulfovibrio sp. Fe33]|uniref:MarR family winged helix-turn-helix transcriptional regulator n=1 Tax=Desulfovibrio sp. Fe33 TaxID=3020842 RepID=UPI00234D34E1|nr:MarR family transcriptional regulator [Desulfovibrio sp. Fe33]
MGIDTFKVRSAADFSRFLTKEPRFFYLYIQMKCDPTLSTYLNNCLYFTANSLARTVGRMAEEAFGDTGISPAHAFLMMLVNERPGLTQKELTQVLQLAPSTVTRFVDSLQRKGLVVRELEGKLSRVSPTDAGLQLKGPIAKAWKSLYRRYSEILGEEEGKHLTAMVSKANRTLEEGG